MTVNIDKTKIIIGIYKITNLKNSKIYIGQSSNIMKRWYQHIINSKSKNKQYERPLYQAIRKYGIDNFNFEIIEVCNLEELINREQYWISYYDCKWPNGYNIYDTNWYNDFNKLTDELVKKITDDIKEGDLSLMQIADKYNIAYNLISDINRGRLQKYRFSDLVYPIRSTEALINETNVDRYKNKIWAGNFLIYWPEIHNYLTNHTIKDTCSHFDFSTNSLRRYMAANNLGLPQEYSMATGPGISRAVKQYDLYGNFIQEFKSATAASIAIHNKDNFSGSILAVCKHIKKTHAGFQWCFINDEISITHNMSVGSHKLVRCVELNKIFDSIIEANKFIGHPKTNTIADCCHEIPGHKTAYGYHWEFVEN